MKTLDERARAIWENCNDCSQACLRRILAGLLEAVAEERAACSRVCLDLAVRGGFADPETVDALGEAAEQIQARRNG